ncbi:MAG: thiol:disulfide interchange protein [Betaproteobacteria bacterium HGW-Betaproteobacteria-1]|jgi:thiol:disulfide interchange protein DsbC|nr:MAG: thiol:disulfide interchange protein [Betaproteobacteria bacterium HGW-Betaproteobacteria-1]
MLKSLLGLLVGTFLISCAYADDAALKKAIESAYPDIQVDSIKKTQYGGLYEVFIGGQIVYTDEKFTFLIAEGRLIDAKTKRNVTGERMEELTRVDFSKLPLDKAIKVVRGNGSRKLVVFSDPDCPFCKRLEQKELAGITDITVYTFLFPLDKLHPDAANKSKAIWCSADRAKSWMDWVLNNKLVKGSTNCESPVESLAKLGQELGVTSTPTLIFADGKRMLGAYPATEIEKALNAAGVKK